MSVHTLRTHLAELWDRPGVAYRCVIQRVSSFEPARYAIDNNRGMSKLGRLLFFFAGLPASSTCVCTCTLLFSFVPPHDLDRTVVDNQ